MPRLLITSTDLMMVQFLVPHVICLSQNGYEIEVACSNVGGWIDKMRETLSPYVVAIHEIKSKRSPFSFVNFQGYLNLKKIMSENLYDIIWTNEPVMGVITRLAARKLRNKGTKVVYLVHGFHFYQGAPLLFWLLYFPVEKFLSRLTDAIITINREDFNSLSRYNFKASHKFLLPGIGVDPSGFAPAEAEEKARLRAEYGYGRDAFILFYAAEFIKRKNHRLIIESAPELARRIPGLKIIFAGHGPLLQKSKRLAARLGVSDTIDFLGYRDDVPRLIALSDVGISSSRQEGLAINIVEDMAGGLPVVATDDRGHRDTVIDGLNGCLFKKGSKADFTAKIQKLYTSPALRADMGKAARATVQRFSIENALQAHIKIYQAVTK